MKNSTQPKNPAELAAEESLGIVYGCLDADKSFLLEAGAGSGKTHSLVMALRYLIKSRGAQLARRNEKIACITFTNVASDEIKSRTDGHPVVFSSTIHAFCWSLIKDFQGFLREELPKWVFRSIVPTDSGPSCPAIPVHRAHPFRSIVPSLRA